MKTRNESKQYVTKDLNSAVEIILMLCITAGGGYSLVNAFRHMLSLGGLYGAIELAGAIITIIAFIMMVSVNVKGFYLYVASHALSFIMTICVDIESGVKVLFASLFSIGLIFFLLQLKKNEISAWKMMQVNEDIKRNESFTIDIQSHNDKETGVADETVCAVPSTELISQFTPERFEDVTDGLPVVIPPSTCQVSRDKEKTDTAKKPGFNVFFCVRFNAFVYISMAILILVNLLSICMDLSVVFHNVAWVSGAVATWRIVLSVINIALTIVIWLWKKSWAYMGLTIISIALIFIVDQMVLERQIDGRGFFVNLILFICAYAPLFITLFLTEEGVSGWQLLFKNVQPMANMEKTTGAKFDVTSSSVDNKEVDRYTRLYNAISPANFVNPYSPEKVKLANELLEALIKNKDNEVVISLIEEKAKAKLGVKFKEK